MPASCRQVNSAPDFSVFCGLHPSVPTRPQTTAPDMGAPHSKTIAALLGPAWGNASLRQVSRLLLFGICSIFLVTITSDNWAISTAHLPGNAESPTASGPAPSFSSSFAPVHSKPKVTQATEDLSNSAHNADDTRTLEILSNLYTHMQKYQHNSPSVSLASSSSEPNSSPNQGIVLWICKVEELVDQSQV